MPKHSWKRRHGPKKRYKQMQLMLVKSVLTNPKDGASVKTANTSTKSILQTNHNSLCLYFGSSHSLLKIRLASADGEVFGLLLFLSKTLQHATPRMVCSRDPSELVPGDSWSAPKVRGLAKGTPAFLVAFCTLAVATSFGGTATQVGSRVAPDKIQTKWWPTHSRERSGCRVH